MPLLVEGETNMHTNFWESSWQRIDEKRLMEYAERKEQADPILETLKSRKAQTVCDAGCGCGAYVRRLAQQGFTVKGFDVSGRAVEIAEDLLEKSGLTAELRTASVLKTGYPDNEFDTVVCRDVLDHIPKEEAERAVAELYRITKPGGIVLMTLDGLDEEYQKEPHFVTPEGDYCFTDGKWKGMVFRAYGEKEAEEIVKTVGSFQIEEFEDGLLVRLEK